MMNVNKVLDNIIKDKKSKTSRKPRRKDGYTWYCSHCGKEHDIEDDRCPFGGNKPGWK